MRAALDVERNAMNTVLAWWRSEGDESGGQKPSQRVAQLAAIGMERILDKQMRHASRLGDFERFTETGRDVP